MSNPQTKFATLSVAVERTRQLYRDIYKKDAPERLTLEDVAALADVDQRTVRRAIHAGDLRAKEERWRYVFDVSDVALWLVTRGRI